MYSEKITGSGFFIKRIINKLQKIDNANNYTLFVNYRLNNPEQFFNLNSSRFKVERVKIGTSKINRIIYEQLILPFKIKNKFDIFFSPVPSFPSVFKNGNIKIITTIHDLTPFIVQGKYNAIQQKYVEYITRKAAKKSDVIITVSENSKNDISKILNVPESMIHVIYNFLDEDLISKKRQRGNNKRKNVFFFVGNLQPGKNIERLLKAFDLFVEENPDFELHLLGKKWKNLNLENLLSKIKWSSKVKIKGYVGEKELLDYYQYSRALIYPSLYEGFGIPPLEAIYYCCPILISNTSSLPEVGGRAAIYVDPYSIKSIKEGMLQIIKEEVVEEKVKYYGEQLAKFDGNIQTMKLLDIFNEL